MTCSCKCCCGCCCDGETGSQTLESPCESPKVFHGKGTICDVCCDLGEIREDITTEEDCPGTWVTNGRCLENPCVYTCPPCPEGNCYFPGSGLIFDGYYPCTEDVASSCCTSLGQQKSRLRLFYTTLPSGITWKAGYPDALAGCGWRWCYDEANTPCYMEDPVGCYFANKFRWRLLVLNCAAESYDDITSQAAEGVFEGEYAGGGDRPVSDCRETPTYLDFISGPVPICPP